jgi:hypothetical protein
MEQSQLLAHCGSSKITREELKVIPTPAGSATHQPLPHFEIVGALVETLSFRQISVGREEYEVSGDGMKMFGVLDLETTFDGCRFSVGVRLQDCLQGTHRHNGNGNDIHRIREQDILDLIRNHPQEINLGKVDQTWFLDLVLLKGREVCEATFPRSSNAAEDDAAA